MAKRKRLTPANPAFLGAAPETKSAFASAPIADVAREASVTAAAQEMAQTLSEARAKGRMVVSVPLDQVQLDYLVRDRVVVDDAEMQALKDSLRARGQQTPVELVDLGDNRFGLISGWRRMAALRALRDETEDDLFATVQGLLRQPEDAQDAYLAMVEENEIRVGLSYFERARIVAKSVEAGVFENDRAALLELFMSASRAKRSKIGSFLPVVRALDGALRFPEAVTERLGLSLSKALTENEDLAAQLRSTLTRAGADTPDQETALLEAAIKAPKAEKPSEKPERKITVATGISLQRQPDGSLVLRGNRVDEALQDQLIAWLRERG